MLFLTINNYDYANVKAWNTLNWVKITTVFILKIDSFKFPNNSSKYVALQSYSTL